MTTAMEMRRGTIGQIVNGICQIYLTPAPAVVIFQPPSQIAWELRLGVPA